MNLTGILPRNNHKIRIARVNRPRFLEKHLKYRSLESFRGLAAILVAIYHSTFVVDYESNFVARSTIFVDFFFILSGFVIAFAYNDRIKDGFSFKQFFLLRFGRLYPLHFFILLVWLLYVTAKSIAFHKFGIGALDPTGHNNIGSFFSNLLLINSLNVHDYLSWNFTAWSISVEFFTYMIFFVCISLFRKVNDLILCLFISALCYFILYINNPDSLLKTYDWGLIRCLGGFFLGSAIYRISQKITLKPSVLVATSAELLALVLMLILVINSLTANYQLATFASFGLVILVFSVQETGLLTKVLTIKPMLFLGALSYSIYMTHALIFKIFAGVGKKILEVPVKATNYEGGTTVFLVTPYANLINLLILLLIIGLSYLTYRYVEIPWRDKFRKYAKNEPKLAAQSRTI